MLYQQSLIPYTRYTVHGRGAKTPKLMNCALTTASKITRSSTFWWSWSRQNLVFNSSKKVSKSRSKPVSICQGYLHFDHFFSTFQKSGFQNTKVTVFGQPCTTFCNNHTKNVSFSSIFGFSYSYMKECSKRFKNGSNRFLEKFYIDMISQFPPTYIFSSTKIVLKMKKKGIFFKFPKDYNRKILFILRKSYLLSLQLWNFENFPENIFFRFQNYFL